jgi:uncharacterized protein
MQLTLNRPGEYLFVRAVGEREITVVDRALTKSFILAPERAIEDWPVADAKAMDAAAVEPILALEPAVVILGAGPRIVFPPQAVLAEFLKRGIGIEVMDNAAAARTYNVLVSEGRRVVAAFILPVG